MINFIHSITQSTLRSRYIPDVVRHARPESQPENCRRKYWARRVPEYLGRPAEGDWCHFSIPTKTHSSWLIEIPSAQVQKITAVHTSIDRQPDRHSRVFQHHRSMFEIFAGNADLINVHPTEGFFRPYRTANI